MVASLSFGMYPAFSKTIDTTSSDRSALMSITLSSLLYAVAFFKILLKTLASLSASPNTVKSSEAWSTTCFPSQQAGDKIHQSFAPAYSIGLCAFRERNRLKVISRNLKNSLINCSRRYALSNVICTYFAFALLACRVPRQAGSDNR